MRIVLAVCLCVGLVACATPEQKDHVENISGDKSRYVTAEDIGLPRGEDVVCVNGVAYFERTLTPIFAGSSHYNSLTFLGCTK